jgi:dipeptidyl aminopeptidase/acylaminoacyl peptidase
MSRVRPIGLLLCAAAVAALAPACTTAPRSGAAVLAPPAALRLAGVPPVPQRLADTIGAYTNFRGVRLLDWHPGGDELLVAFLRDGRPQLHRVPGAGAPLQPVTRANEPTRFGAYVAAQPDLIVFQRDVGGDEASRIYRIDRDGNETPLTPPGRRSDLAAPNRDGTALFALAVPLDRSARGTTLERKGVAVNTELLRIDPVTGSQRVLATLPGVGWEVDDASADERTLLLGKFKSATDIELWSLDVAEGAPRRLLPRAGEPAASYERARYAADGRIFVISDRGGEFQRLLRFDPVSGVFEPLAADVRWDVERMDVSRDRHRLAIVVNEGGRGVARLVDPVSLRVTPLPVAGGASVTAVRFSPDGRRLAIETTSSAAPHTVSVIDLESGATTAWALPDTAGFDTSRFGATEVFDWPSFDGRRISGLITRPDARRFPGRRPVLIDIHGGPEAQARLGFLGRSTYFVNELGLAVIEPNVRGSNGFGRTFLQLDDGRKREDSVGDIGTLLDWIARQPDLDAARVAVAGGSYGGYMVYASAVHFPDRIRAAVSAVGISHFVTFLERTESYRRDLRRGEYGDERDPAMRAFLHEISPLTQAARIRAPLFVLHGRNDPRVPVTEAEQIVRTVAAQGVPVWSLIADDEGHGFAKKENADYAFYARVLFLRRYLLGDG